MLDLAGVPARFQADRPALVHGDARWTFGDLDRRARAWARHLGARGVGPDDLVAFARPNGPDFLALAFGIYRAGATPAPLSSAMPPAERDAVLAVMRPRVFVGPDEVPGDGADPASHLAASWKACTSGGSTGLPKVIVDARPAGFEAGTDFIGIPADDTVLVPGPLYHNAPFSAAVFALWRGCTVVTMPRFDAGAALDLIAAERVAWALMVPTMMHRILTLPEAERQARELSAWRTVVHTAAPMPAWTKCAWINWLGADHVWEVYGSTEGLARCWIGGAEWLERLGSVGRPIGGARLRVLNPEGRDLPPGWTGEIYAMPPGGPGSTYHYIGAEGRRTADGWETVGDCGHLDADGFLFLADRRADLIITGGVNVWPAEVEAAILRHPAVRSCAVVGLDDPDLGQRVHAVIEAERDVPLAELDAFLADYLARAKRPRSVERRDAVRDDAGKFRKPAGRRIPA